jgi:chromosome segregation ATPase
MFKAFSEMKHHLAEIEASVKKQTDLVWSMTWDLRRLREENDEYKSWNSKLKAKNSSLRKERRRLRQILDDHGIEHQPQTFHEKTLPPNQSGV